ncbi:SHIRT domain-containing protein [Leucobacter sp. UT-8R-CII-1-4]|uniref:SHIRT domain-containing protein n=1 Tax=Leucobacter sp. UT-8R-CII-1-4 TaxID=3040075 RepID=UPI0024A99E53|nr:SHIRT domain-containing protein [Leucobacter sp. UT-8R-CII-1-4]MDI6022760.1 SHIRT domain-containing protein [Leucobacter sp. UT-8R-CII-1-4]
MKPLATSAIAMIAAAGLLLGTASSAQAATPVTISVAADAYALDDSGQITGSNEFLYDSAKGDEASNAYQIAYRGTLNMRSLWSSYRLFKVAWLFSPGNNQAEWERKTFSGNWDIAFHVDNTVVTSDPSFVDCTALQSEIEAQNPDTGLSRFIRCTSVSYDDASGQYNAQFILMNEDGSKVTGKQLDSNQPNILRLTTPAQAFYVKQSAFEAGKTFEMTQPSVNGEMRMDAFFHSMMPLTFDAVGNDVSLTMVNTYDASFEFVSNAPGRALSADVQALLPPTKTMLVDGSTVQPPVPALTSVADTQGTWTFAGWTPNESVITGANVSFVGAWDFTVDPDAQFNVTYRFVDTSGNPVPPQLASVQPLSGTATQGDTVQAATFPSNDVNTSAGTWSFAGWQENPIVVDGLDIEFVGVWSFSKTVVPPIDGGSGGLANSGAEPQPLLIGAGILALLSGALVLATSARTARRR